MAAAPRYTSAYLVAAGPLDGSGKIDPRGNYVSITVHTRSRNLRLLIPKKQARALGEELAYILNRRLG